MVTETGLGLAVCFSALVFGSAMASERGGAQPRSPPTKPAVTEPLIYIDRGRPPIVLSTSIGEAAWPQELNRWKQTGASTEYG